MQNWLMLIKDIYVTMVTAISDTCVLYTGANRLASVDISTRLCMTFACVTCVDVKTERWRQLIFASRKYELSPAFSFDNVTHVTRTQIIHSLVEISSPAIQLAPVVICGKNFNPIASFAKTLSRGFIIEFMRIEPRKQNYLSWHRVNIHYSAEYWPEDNPNCTALWVYLLNVILLCSRAACLRSLALLMVVVWKYLSSWNLWHIGRLPPR